MSLSCSIALYPKDHFLAIFKEACVTPVVKKPGFYATDISSYGPISNLLVVSQFLERLVICQLMRYLMCSSAFIGCGSQREYNTRAPCLLTDFFVVENYDTGTWDHSDVLIDGPSIQLSAIA